MKRLFSMKLGGKRDFSTITEVLKRKFEESTKKDLELLSTLKKQHGKDAISDPVTVSQCVTGMRGIKSLLTQTSDLHADQGILYRGLSLDECSRVLPTREGGEIPLPEAVFWLLLTGEKPSLEDVEQLRDELHKRATLPEDVLATLDQLPKNMHPMTQLSITMLSCQHHSVFAQKYYNGTVSRAEFWESYLEDALTLIARVPILAARIYRRTFKDGTYIPPDTSLDWAGNFAHMLGITEDPKFKELIRLYLFLHADHEGGNVSAHATHLVGSALSDCYYSWTAGLCGLAGPLHGLANQECLRWLMKLKEDFKDEEVTVEEIAKIAERTLAEGKVIPGFGHAVLRVVDPRYMLQRKFAMKHMKEDPLVQLVDACFHAIPPVLKKTGKVSNPYPNVDAHSGACLAYYGLTESDFYTVVFAVSRSIGVMAQLVHSRRLGLAIERPKSVTLNWLAEKVKVESKL